MRSATSPQIQRYLNKVSGPLFDRIAIHVEVPRTIRDLEIEIPGESFGCSYRSVAGYVAKRRKEIYVVSNLRELVGNFFGHKGQITVMPIRK